MAKLFYNQRHSNKEIGYEIDEHFWYAFTSYIERMGKDLYFAEKLGYELRFGHVVGLSQEKLRSNMREHLGFSVNIEEAISVSNPLLSTSEILSVVELMFVFISKPMNTWFEMSEEMFFATEFDSAKGKYEYTVKINELFAQNRLGYRLKLGYVLKARSHALDERFDEVEIIDDDKILKDEVLKAVKMFRDPLLDKSDIALTIIANALERTKTLKGNNKRQSLDEILNQVTNDGELKGLLDVHIRTFTEISNNCNIRHKEIDKIIVEDKDIKDFLFYGYYNLIRLILSKLNMLK